MSLTARWPGGKRFAFTIFDDPDGQTLAAGRMVYAFLQELGLLTTKGIWPVSGDAPPSDLGGTCDDPAYRDWCLDLAEAGFEPGYHNATQYTSERATTARALQRHHELFQRMRITMSNHYNCAEAIYWGDHRLSGWRRRVYNAATRGGRRGVSSGHVPESPLFWGDLCQRHTQYVRNFVYADINTLAACPWMPYHDPERPFVNYWYASSEGANVRSFLAMLSEANQDRLASEGGACIMYTHFGHGFVRDGELDPEFRRLMTRLSRMDGWFVPVSTLLDHLRERNGGHVITGSERATLERRWLLDKLRRGTS